MHKSPHECWKVIESWIEKNIPDSHELLREGARPEAISALEEKLGVKFPDSFVEFYKIHDGQNAGSIGLIGGETLLPLDHIADNWSIWKELLDEGAFDDNQSTPEKGIKNNWWNPKWIPVTCDGSGNHHCIDFDPDEGGSPGQIIQTWHDDDFRLLIADSFSDWMNRYVSRLENGDYFYAEEYFGGIILKEDLDSETDPK